MLRQNVNIRLQARLDSSRIRVTHGSLYLDKNHFALTKFYRFLPDQRFWSYWRNAEGRFEIGWCLCFEDSGSLVR